MRDLRVGRDINVLGDMIVHDESPSYKLLGQCSDRVLMEEERHRQGLLEDECQRKFSKFLVALGAAAILLFLTGGWYWFQGGIDAFSLLSGAAGVLLGLGSLNVYHQPTAFEKRQLNALHEIKMLLRERGVRR
ncbi:hypothetical protein ACOTIX_23085 [Achromobacter xylosoxidans]